MSPALIDLRIRPPWRDTPADPELELGPGMEQYERLYGMRARVNLTFEELTAAMERHDVRGVMQAEYEGSGEAGRVNDRVAELVGRRPDLFLGGIATVDPGPAPSMVEELERSHDELGLRGVVVQPGFLRMYPTDPRLEPVYEFCQRRGVPVTLHTGVNFSSYGAIDFGRPLWVDMVACAYPDLVLVCNHGGWPWVAESIAVAWKHPNVHLEFGAVSPKYMADPRGGWAPMPHWMRTQLRGQVLLGTDWPMLAYDTLLEQLPLLELSPEAETAYRRGNAERILDGLWG